MNPRSRDKQENEVVKSDLKKYSLISDDEILEEELVKEIGFSLFLWWFYEDWADFSTDSLKFVDVGDDKEYFLNVIVPPKESVIFPTDRRFIRVSTLLQKFGTEGTDEIHNVTLNALRFNAMSLRNNLVESPDGSRGECSLTEELTSLEVAENSDERADLLTSQLTELIDQDICFGECLGGYCFKVAAPFQCLDELRNDQNNIEALFNIFLAIYLGLKLDYDTYYGEIRLEDHNSVELDVFLKNEGEPAEVVELTASNINNQGTHQSKKITTVLKLMSISPRTELRKLYIAPILGENSESYRLLKDNLDGLDLEFIEILENQPLANEQFEENFMREVYESFLENIMDRIG